MTRASPLILAFGDSLVAGYGLSAAAGFTAQLEASLRVHHPAAQVVNAGRSGDTTEQARQRLPRVLSALSARPDLAIVQLGANDVLRGVSPVRTREQLALIVAELHRCGVPVLLATLTLPPFLRAHLGAYLDIHHDVAREHGAATCDFFPAGVLGRADMVLADRLHPNARAIAAVVAHMLPAIERALSGSRADAA